MIVYKALYLNAAEEVLVVLFRTLTLYELEWQIFIYHDARLDRSNEFL